MNQDADAIQWGSAGTEVVANPQGESTDTLSKLQVNTTIYSVGLPYLSVVDGQLCMTYEEN